jgi:hypothetical protein
MARPKATVVIRLTASEARIVMRVMRLLSKKARPSTRAKMIPRDQHATTADHFWSKVEKLPDSPGCWLWNGSINDKGYGVFSRGARKSVTRNMKAHRVAWELTRGPIPPGETLDHLCRLRCCVNPNHIQLVTSRENTKRMLVARAHDARRLIRSPGVEIARAAARDGSGA